MTQENKNIASLQHCGPEVWILNAAHPEDLRLIGGFSRTKGLGKPESKEEQMLLKTPKRGAPAPAPGFVLPSLEHLSNAPFRFGVSPIRELWSTGRRLGSQVMAHTQSGAQTGFSVLDHHLFTEVTFSQTLLECVMLRDTIPFFCCFSVSRQIKSMTWFLCVSTIQLSFQLPFPPKYIHITCVCCPNSAPSVLDLGEV